jgi:Na+/H+ antiporter NhaD/arsenite permease-like protein
VHTLLGPDAIRGLVLGVFAATFVLVLARALPVPLVALGAAALLVAAGAVSPREAAGRFISWDAIGLYFGFGVLAVALRESHWPRLAANLALRRLRRERHVLLFLYALAAALSAVLPNPVVVLLLAPLAFDLAERLAVPPFRALVGIAAASNAVTTVSMVADLPTIILASETGMRFIDFYWFKARPGLGTISVAAIAAAFAVFAFQLRRLDREATLRRDAVRVRVGPLVVFGLGVAGLLVPALARSPGLVGLAVGGLSLALLSDRIPQTLRETDWGSMLFLAGIFVVTGAVEKFGFLRDAAAFVVRLGLTNTVLLVSLVTWISVLLSSFIDNVPYTVLMIPVCRTLARDLGIDAEPLLYGMLVGTGIGGNLTPVGATANVLACGMLEKRGVPVRLGSYLAVTAPFTLAAVLAAELLVLLFWA